MQANHLWRDLPLEVQTEFQKSSIQLKLKRGDVIYRHGDSPKGIYYIQNGLVGLVLTGVNSGKEHLLRFFKSSQFFGHRSLFSNEPHHATTRVLENTDLILVPKTTVLKVIQDHPTILDHFIKVLSQELRRCENQHVMILENEILSRVAQALVYLKDLYPEHNWTRQEIADFCASTVSTVIKAMAELEEKSLISQHGRSIDVLNREGLIALQEEGLR